MKSGKIIFNFFMAGMLFWASGVSAREANLMEAYYLRLSGYEDFRSSYLPGSSMRLCDDCIFRVEVVGAANKLLPGFVSGVQGGDQEGLTETVTEYFGEPIDGFGRMAVGVGLGDFRQTFALAAGGIFIANDPVFSEFSGFVFQDVTGITAYEPTLGERFRMRPRVIYGRRRQINSGFSVADLVDRKPNLNFKNASWEPFMDLGVDSSVDIFIGSLFFEVNSLPIRKSSVEYWDTQLGFWTHDLSSPKESDLQFFASFSPLYAGSFRKSRTIRLGTEMSFGHVFGFDFFLADRFNPGGAFSIDSGLVNFSFFSFHQSLDDFGRESSRRFGLQFKLGF